MSLAVHTDEWTLREEQPADEPFVADLYRSIWREDDPGFARCSPQQQKDIIAFNRIVQAQTIEAICPTAVSSIILIGGHRGGELIVDRTATCIRLIEIALLPQHRRRGLGGGIVQSLCSDAAARGVPVSLRVAVTNGGARRFYARHGFVITDSDDKYVDMTWLPDQR
jgi:GNAT superfamily N-acetyltransferase